MSTFELREAFDALSPNEANTPAHLRVWARYIRIQRLPGPVLELRDPTHGTGEPAGSPRWQYWFRHGALWQRKMPPAPLSKREEETPYKDRPATWLLSQWGTLPPKDGEAPIPAHIQPWAEAMRRNGSEPWSYPYGPAAKVMNMPDTYKRCCAWSGLRLKGSDLITPISDGYDSATGRYLNPRYVLTEFLDYAIWHWHWHKPNQYTRAIDFMLPAQMSCGVRFPNLKLLQKDRTIVEYEWDWTRQAFKPAADYLWDRETLLSAEEMQAILRGRAVMYCFYPGTPDYNPNWDEQRFAHV